VRAIGTPGVLSRYNADTSSSACECMTTRAGEFRTRHATQVYHNLRSHNLRLYQLRYVMNSAAETDDATV